MQQQQQNPTPIDFVRQLAADFSAQLPPSARYAVNIVAEATIGDLDAEVVAAKQLRGENAEMQKKLDQREARVAELDVEIDRLSARIADLIDEKTRVVDMGNPGQLVSGEANPRIVEMNPLPGSRTGSLNEA
jgi:hypothetical protein